jgi:hypothetical protein
VLVADNDQTKKKSDVFVYVLSMFYTTARSTVVLGVYDSMEKGFAAATYDQNKFNPKEVGDPNLKVNVVYGDDTCASIFIRKESRVVRTYRIQRYRLNGKIGGGFVPKTQGKNV